MTEGEQGLPTMIEDDNSRANTYCKRKRGLIKKIIELSKLCKQEICMVMFDNDRQRIVHFKSSEEFTLRTAKYLLSEPVVSNFFAERYTCDDYELFRNYSTVKKQTKPGEKNSFDWVKYAKSSSRKRKR